ncbi:Senescence/dehydration-associated protein [Thalictrum thalictroides]|uniref:Senescence/dehydration-associated protein n=1 Tax=Thalictrum thalictroides TaxID=46969 RepID=A0A7J6WNA2_THATH|nr:Senescence/dehydration-associated protein [Thalictrum thalictroides]
MFNPFKSSTIDQEKPRKIEDMNCFRSRSAHAKKSQPPSSLPLEQEHRPKPKQELLLQIPECTLHLIQGGETTELTKGDFTLIRLLDENIPLAFILKVGNELQWPLTKDEPVVKLSKLNYLFSLPLKDGDPLSYGVSFSEQFSSDLALFDSFLNQHSCFSVVTPSPLNGHKAVDWKEYAPRIDSYNGVLAKAIATGTGEIVKGIFNCSNAYAKQVQKGGEMITGPTAKEKKATFAQGSDKNGTQMNKSNINKGLKRVRNLSKMTEKMSKSLLNGVGVVSGSVVKPIIKSPAGKALLANVPGEVLLASLDAINKVLDAVEVAEKQALSATSKATSRMVSNRFGESAGEATEDIFATAGHCAGTAWNIFKIRKAINPASSLPSAAVKTAIKSNRH